MNNTVRGSLATLAGLATTFVALGLLEYSLTAMLPGPPMQTDADAVSQAAFMEGLPISFHVGLAFTYLVAGTLGGIVVYLVAPNPVPLWPVLLLSALYAAAGIANFWMIAHPIGTVVASIIFIIFSPYLGQNVAKAYIKQR
jgi:uncharacterized BrkB/YihY/UPF0761 family membrane protein